MQRGDLRTTILVRSGKDTTSAWLSESIINDMIDDANTWVSGYRKWAFSEGRASTTFASLVTDEDGLLRGELPENWKTDSIRMMTIGGKIVDKKEYTTFRKFLEQNSPTNKRYFTDLARSYYVNAGIDISGTVTVYGQYTPARIADGDANDLTEIPVTSLDETTEALIQEVLSYIASRDQNDNLASSKHEKAEKILINLWNRIQEEQSNYQSASVEGMWKRIDILQGAAVDDLNNPNRWLS